MTHFSPKPKPPSSFFEFKEIQQASPLASPRQKLSSSDIIALDNEKDLHDALNNILEKNINEKKEKFLQNRPLMIKEESPFDKEVDENENSFIGDENSMRFSEKIESFSPLQNKSLMSNINEILSMINKDDISNNSCLSLLNIPDEKNPPAELDLPSKSLKFNGI